MPERNYRVVLARKPSLQMLLFDCLTVFRLRSQLRVTGTAVLSRGNHQSFMKEATINSPEIGIERILCSKNSVKSNLPAS